MVDTVEGYLKNALFYSSSSSRCFFQPAGMTVNELEKGLIDLRLRLASLRGTLRRSLVRNPTNAALLLGLNVGFHRDSRRMAAAWEARQMDNVAQGSEDNSVYRTLDSLFR